jgi:hypothetical protein
MLNPPTTKGGSQATQADVVDVPSELTDRPSFVGGAGDAKVPPFTLASRSRTDRHPGRPRRRLD